MFAVEDAKQSKILPCADPFVTSYPHHACFMSIIGDDVHYRDAILSAYIPLAFNASYRRLDFSVGVDIVEFMEHLPFLEGKYIDRKTIKKRNIRYADYIKNEIAIDDYVYLLVDYYYISADISCFHKKHRKHDIFVYGYDDLYKKFWVKDFLDGSKYRSFDVSYEEMEQAASQLEMEQDWLRGIKSYRKKSVIHEEIYFHMPVILEEIEKYICGKKSGYVSFNDIRMRQDCDYYYGSHIYEQLIKECTFRYEHDELMDTRCFHILFEHKKCLLYLCEKWNRDYMLDNADELFALLQNILNLCYILRNFSLAYNLNKKEKCYKNIIHYLKKIHDEELHAMMLLSKNIKLTTQFPNYVTKEEANINDSTLEFVSEWRLTANKDALFTETENAYMQTLFYGTDVEIVMDSSYYDEHLDIKIDGKSLTMQNLSKFIHPDKHEIMYKINGWEEGFHTLKVFNEKGVCSIKKIIYHHTDGFCNADSNTCCKLDRIDYTTKGNWTGVYGSDGYYLIGGKYVIPSYMTEQSVKFCNAYLLVWDSDSWDERALVNPATGKRIMVYQESKDEFCVNVIIAGQISREITLYFADFERFHTDLRIEVFNKLHHKLLDTVKLNRVDDGLYLTFKALGDILFKIFKESGRLAFVSGIFFQS